MFDSIINYTLSKFHITVIIYDKQQYIGVLHELELVYSGYFSLFSQHYYMVTYTFVKSVAGLRE